MKGFLLCRSNFCDPGGEDLVLSSILLRVEPPENGSSLFRYMVVLDDLPRVGTCVTSGVHDSSGVFRRQPRVSERIFKHTSTRVSVPGRLSNTKVHSQPQLRLSVTEETVERVKR